MNPIYHAIVALLVISGMLTDLPKLRKQPTASVTVYLIVAVLAVGLWVIQLMQIDLIMPTQLWLNKIYPWLQTLVNLGDIST